MGFDHMITPNLDRLVRRGTAFEKMYITSPSCAPSRASLFTGVYPHTNGVFRNDEIWNYCWVKDLAEAGYHTVNVGKMHTMPAEGAFGFHERHVVENKDRDHPNLPFLLWTIGTRHFFFAWSGEAIARFAAQALGLRRPLGSLGLGT